MWEELPLPCPSKQFSYDVHPGKTEKPGDETSRKVQNRNGGKHQENSRAELRELAAPHSGEDGFVGTWSRRCCWEGNSNVWDIFIHLPWEFWPSAGLGRKKLEQELPGCGVVQPE